MGLSAEGLASAARQHPWRAGLAGAGAGLLLASAVFWATLPDVSGAATGWPDTTAYMELRVRQAREAGRSLDLRYRPVPLERIPDHLQRAVRMAEDAGFYGHEGVDWAELEKALSEAWEERRLPRGASTITQQLARNLYLSPSRSPWRKLREFFIARRLERELGKRRILELYLNVIEFGDGIFGVDAAARRYFGVPVSRLDREQSLGLAAAIPAPRTHNPATDTRRYRWRVQLIRHRLAVVDSVRRARTSPGSRVDTAAGVPPAPPPIELPPAESLPAAAAESAAAASPTGDTSPASDTSATRDTLPAGEAVPEADTASIRAAGADQPPESALSMRERWARYSGRADRSAVSAASRNRSMWASRSAAPPAARAARRWPSRWPGTRVRMLSARARAAVVSPSSSASMPTWKWASGSHPSAGIRP